MFYDDIFRALNNLVPDFRLFILKGKNYKTNIGPLRIELYNFQKNILVMYVYIFTSIYIYKIHVNPKDSEAELLLPDSMMLREKISKNISFANTINEIIEAQKSKK